MERLRRQLQSEIDKMSECQVNRVIEFLKRNLSNQGHYSWSADRLEVDLSDLTLDRQQALLAFAKSITAETNAIGEDLLIPGLPSPVGSDCEVV